MRGDRLEGQHRNDYACLPIGMKAGVRTSPCAVAISPRRAAPSVASSVKPKSGAIRGLMMSGREAFHEIRRRKAYDFIPATASCTALL